ncbi:MAG: ribosome biogenesis GTPase Der [Candidatus Magasanikbacteria bacterium]|nr:ribosome biogenesis GTPase Der [Candidatus Magasanikbacteria bacterium]
MTIVLPEKQLPTIAIVGRTNVGKSALFNRLTEKRKAMVSKVAGTTRTSNVAPFLWRGITYRLIDTGGIDFDKKATYEKEIQTQIDKAIEEARAIIFLVDLQSGIMPQEKLWAQELRKIKIPIVFVGNKADNPKIRLQIHEQDWRKLGFGEPVPISAVNGSGVGDLLDVVIEKLSPQIKSLKTIKPMEKMATRVAIIGRPNVGKSSLFNALIGEERVIVSPVPFTTRETHDTLMLLDGEPFLFLDTAGLRRQSRIKSSSLEKISARQTESGLRHTDLVLLVLDASEPFAGQDKRLSMLVKESQKSLIIVINKFDLFQDQGEEAEEKIRRDFALTFPFLAYAPIVFVSAKTHWRVHKVFEMIRKVMLGRGKTIEESVLADLMKRLIHHRLPTKGKGVRHPHIYSLKQVAIDPPTFQVAIKQKTSLHESYLRFIENQLRAEFNLIGTPVVVYAKKINI